MPQLGRPVFAWARPGPSPLTRALKTPPPLCLFRARGPPPLSFRPFPHSSAADERGRREVACDSVQVEFFQLYLSIVNLKFHVGTVIWRSIYTNNSNYSLILACFSIWCFQGKKIIKKWILHVFLFCIFHLKQRLAPYLQRQFSVYSCSYKCNVSAIAIFALHLD